MQSHITYFIHVSQSEFEHFFLVLQVSQLFSALNGEFPHGLPLSQELSDAILQADTKTTHTAQALCESTALITHNLSQGVWVTSFAI
jgi:hypothetical protein